MRVTKLVALVLAAFAVAGGQTTATIDIDTTSTTPIHSNFSGINDDPEFPVEYWDYRFNSLALSVGYGWVRFPGGSGSDIYNWQTGQEVASWFAKFAGDTAGPGQAVLQHISGKGGARLIDAANRANFLGAPLIICVNGFTDTPQSAGQLAAFVKANSISVAAWELSNEPYLFPDFWPDATTYVTGMRPYRDAIKAVDPNAVISVFVRDPAVTKTVNTWNQALASYSDQYWDALSFHHYPAQSSGNFEQWMADENAALATRTNTMVTNELTPIGPSGVKFMVTEFDPSIPNDSKTGLVSITDGTLWGGIYSAEFIMRMSTVGSVIHVGPHAIATVAGVQATNNHYGDVLNAAGAGKSIDTLALDFGFYVTAQANALAVLNGVINHAIQSNKTTVIGGATVPATGITGGIPALYAVSYSNAAGGLSLVVANKSATAHQLTIRVNGAAATGPFPLQFVAGSDPSAANTPTNPSLVSIQTANSGNPVTVPAYSVMSVALKAPPVATFVNAASYQTGAMAPGQLVAAFGSGFASQLITAQQQPLPRTLGDTTIDITDSKGKVTGAPLLYVAPLQASFLLPDAVASGPATVKVMRGGTTVLTGAMDVAAVSPGLFSENGNGAGVAAAYYVRGSEPTSASFVFRCQAGTPLSCLSAPISPGATGDTVYVTLYGTGIRGAQKVEAYVAGQSVPVQYAGAQGQYQGLDQVNISIPQALAGAGEASVYIVADGKSSNMTTINIQ